MMTTSLTPSVRAALHGAVQAGGHDWSLIEDELREGRIAIWTHGGFAVTTEVDQEDVCHIRLGGGSGAKQSVAALEVEIMAHPAHAGVTKYRIWGRPGWARLFPHWRRCGVEDGLMVLERDA